MSALAKMLAKHHTAGTITAAEQLNPTTRRIRVTADTPVILPYTPGQHVRIQINGPLSLHGLLRPLDTLRSYSIWEYTARERALELRAHLYRGEDDEGIGLRWARAAEPGQPVTFWGPQGDFTTRPASYHLFVGDETATVAFGAMIRALGSAERAYGVLESDSPAHDLAIPGPHRLHRVHRAGAPASSSPTLLAAVADLDLPDHAGAAYIAGEARTCQKIRDHLVRERGWPRKAITVKPFWTPGKRGLH